MIRVLMISDSYPSDISVTSGIFVHEQAIELKKQGVEIEVINPVPYPLLGRYKIFDKLPNEKTIDGIKVHYLRYRLLPSKYGRYISTYMLKRKILSSIDLILNDFKPDLIHSHWATPSGYAGLMLGKCLNIPTICTLRGSDINIHAYNDPMMMKITKKVLENTEKIIAVSKAMKKAAENIAIPKEKIEVVYNGTDINQFCCNHEKDENTKFEDEKNYKLLFVGRIIREKGIWELLEAFLNVLVHYPNTELYIIGEGNEQKAIKQYCLDNNINDKVKFLGVLPHTELVKSYQNCDLFILPSYSEGLPNVIVEAMSCGKPVIATNIGGIPEIVNSETGSLIPVKDTNSLSLEIINLFKNKELLRTKGRNARKMIEQRFNRENNVNKIVTIYGDLLKKVCVDNN
jgi:teichuronic acid biosynthesis glycosyltransferase TuaC